MPKILKYQSDSITVNYDIKKCIHAAECVRGLPAVFDPEQRPWIAPSKATADEIADTIHLCPSGALTYVRHDGGAAEKSPSSNSISLAADGPLYVTGNIGIIDHEGSQIAAGTRFALCRCGHSSNKPFCDNSHKKHDFSAGTELGEGGIKPVEDFTDGEELVITTSENGPLLFNGPMHIQNSDGSDARSGMKSALCRCGQSDNKPFCTGAHRTAGFVGLNVAEN
ncbi:MAG: hypothetical protein HKN43_00985 [Rhodothermales bacterium]|nr:hypothetical protein [Rhodothermales bacterium]